MARTDNLTNFLTDIASAIKEKKGDISPIKASEFDAEIKNLPSGGDIDPPDPKFTGHLDEQGLKQIGWTDDDINYLKDAINWNEEDDEWYKLTDDELALDTSSNSRFFPTIKTGQPIGLGKKLIAIPNSFYQTINSFYGCNSLLKLPNYSALTLLSSNCSFKDCYCIKEIPNTYDFSNLTTANRLFANCRSLKKVNDIILPKATDTSYMFQYCTSIKEVGTITCSKSTNCAYSFQYCYNLKEAPKIESEIINNTSYMFSCCYSLQKINSLNTSKVTDMNHMFEHCYNLKEIPHIDTSNVINMAYMFYNCSILRSIPLLNTEKVTNISYMFHQCYNLSNIPNLDIKSATNTAYMFSACSNLKKCPSLNTANATNMQSMFNGCYTLESVPLLNCESCNSISAIFGSCENLTNLGGLKDLGKAYTNKSAKYYQYTLTLSACSKLTHDSLMNVINNLYDLNITYNVAGGGTLYRQSLVLGSTNKAKLTTDEIAIATNKGWDVS